MQRFAAVAFHMKNPPVSSSLTRTFQRRLLAWYRECGRDLSWRKTRDPYHIVVAELMLQQTQVDRVIEKYHAWLQRFPTTRVLARASTQDVLAAWQGLGYNRRALYLHRIAQEIETKYAGVFPRTRSEIHALPGIGPYTAGAIMSFAFGAREAILDTNVKRILIRVFVGFRRGKWIEDTQLWEMMRALLPKQDDVYDLNQGLMDLGALVCTATQPACGTCPLRRMCASYPEILEAPSSALRLTKPAKEPLYFGQPRRIWRGKVLKYLHQTGQRGATVLEIGRAIQSDFTRERIPWLRTVVDVLQKDGLVRRERNRVMLPQ